MKILGISGLDNSVSFKQAHFPGLDDREYRISQGHDSAAALIVDGQCVAAAAEERFSREKHTGAFPSQAIRYCLSVAGIDPADVDEIAHGFDFRPYRRAYSLNPATAEQFEAVFSREALLRRLWREFPSFSADRVHNVDHHMAHAASAYYTSGWSDCAVAVIDAMGEAHSASLYAARQGRIELLQRIPANDSVGILYSLVTLHLGFDFNADEYKIMGLAPYGDPARFRSFFENAVGLCDDGAVRIPLLRLNRTRDERETYSQSRQYLSDHLCPERAADAPITDVHCDVAAALQECLERAVLHVCLRAAERAFTRRLALAGGVALNCAANGALARSGHFEQIYIQPAAGDDGTALGAALYRAAATGALPVERFPVPFLGPGPTTTETESALRHFADRVDITRFDSLEETCRSAAALIHSGKVIAWCRGRMEYGPRALGHRSILADPRDPAMRARLNSMVKMREEFRPFAPAVTGEQVHRWFEVPPGTELPYMITNVIVREPYRCALPAVTHVNGTARVQTVHRRDNLEFHTLLRAVGELSGYEMAVNTSFNVKGQPIVNTPREAIDTYLHTGIDALFLEDMLVSRRSQG